jgi:DNA ligase D-like protein (predicted ligase)
LNDGKRSGLGLLPPAANATRRSARRLSRVDPAVIPGARPAVMPRQIDVPLATLKTTVPTGDDWLHETKYDGYRMLARIARRRSSFITRNHHDWTNRFPELAEAVTRLSAHAGAVLDGEIVKFDAKGISHFSALQDALSTKRTADLVYVVFDLVYLDGFDLRDAALEDRKEALAFLLQNAPRSIRYSEHQMGKGTGFFREACAKELEGIVSKQRQSHYRGGRTLAWVKVKCTNVEEFVIIGFTDPKGSRTGFGALLLGYYTPQGDLVYAGKVGTGFDLNFLAAFRKRLGRIERRQPTTWLPKGVRLSSSIHFVEPSYVAQIGFTEWTVDNLLRHPRFLGLREDKAPTEVVIDRRPPAVLKSARR